MKFAILYVSVPAVAGLLKVLLSHVGYYQLFFLVPTNSSPPTNNDEAFAQQQRCLQGVGSQEDCANFDPTTFQSVNEERNVVGDADDDEEEDPMLREMPGTNGFKAYVRADIATFYGREPGSMIESPPQFNGQAAKFVNMSPERVTMYWIDNNNTPHFHGNLGPWHAKGTASFPGHHFTMTRANQPDAVLCHIRIVKDVSTYYCNPFAENNPHDPEHAEHVHPVRSLEQDLIHPHDRTNYEQHVFNKDFAARYKAFTGGSEWLTMWPRDPPRHTMWRADVLGQTHTITTKETYFVQLPTTTSTSLSSSEEQRTLPQLTWEQMKTPDDAYLRPFRAPGRTMNMTIKAISCAPRVFEVPGFLSEVEADHILDIVRQRELKRSTTGSGEESSVRTSRTTWIPRQTDVVLNAIYRRAADLLRIDEALFRKRLPGEVTRYEHLDPINEDIQIVHYDTSQEYTAHHDFGYPTGLPGTPSRSINIAFYLNNVTAGGYTAFPRWRNAEGGIPLNIQPEKTKAVIFYMINPDGNLDDLSQHAGTPVLEGEKWFANLWIHDPYFSR